MDREIYEFTQAVGAEEPQPGKEVYPMFRRFFPRSNYFLLGGKFLLVKISRSQRPFWGIGKKFVDILNQFDFFLVLLVSEREGWAFSKSEVNSNIDSHRWPHRQKDDNYKINPPLPDKNSFSNPRAFLNKIGIA